MYELLLADYLANVCGMPVADIRNVYRMPVVENECPEGNAEGLKILRESLKKVQITTSSPSDATHVFVVFGASGDLAKKKIYPTLWALFRDGLMPPGTQIYGYARSKMTVAQLRERCEGTVKAKEGEEADMERFWASNHYVAGSYDTQRDFEILNQVSECPHYLVIMMTCYRRWRVWRRNTPTDCFTLHFLPASSSLSRQC